MLASCALVFNAATVRTPFGMNVDAASSMASALLLKPTTAATRASCTRCRAARDASTVSSHEMIPSGGTAPCPSCAARGPIVCAKSRRASSTACDSTTPKSFASGPVSGYSVPNHTVASFSRLLGSARTVQSSDPSAAQRPSRGVQRKGLPPWAMMHSWFVVHTLAGGAAAVALPGALGAARNRAQTPAPKAATASKETTSAAATRLVLVAPILGIGSDDGEERENDGQGRGSDREGGAACVSIWLMSEAVGKRGTTNLGAV